MRSNNKNKNGVIIENSYGEVEYINNDPKLHIKSYYYNRKYTIDELLPYIIDYLYPYLYHILCLYTIL